MYLESILYTRYMYFTATLSSNPTILASASATDSCSYIHMLHIHTPPVLASQQHHLRYPHHRQRRGATPRRNWTHLLYTSHSACPTLNFATACGSKERSSTGQTTRGTGSDSGATGSGSRAAPVQPRPAQPRWTQGRQGTEATAPTARGDTPVLAVPAVNLHEQDPQAGSVPTEEANCVCTFCSNAFSFDSDQQYKSSPPPPPHKSPLALCFVMF